MCRCDELKSLRDDREYESERAYRFESTMNALVSARASVMKELVRRNVDEVERDAIVYDVDGQIGTFRNLFYVALATIELIDEKIHQLEEDGYVDVQ